MAHKDASPTPDSSCLLEEWEDAPLCREIFTLNNLMMRTAERFVADLGLTSSRWLLLGAISDHEEKGEFPTITDLSEHALLSVQNVSRMLGPVEGLGFVERFRVPGEGRTVRVRLTDEGRSTLEEACSRSEQLIEGLLRGFDAKRTRQARSTLIELVTNLHDLSAAIDEKGIEPFLPRHNAAQTTHTERPRETP